MDLISIVGDKIEGHHPAIVDQTADARALVTVDSVHNRVHRGQLFSIDQFVLGVANNGSIDFLIRVTTALHISPRGSAGGDARMFIYEGPTTTSDGDTATAKNRNRSSSKVTVSEFFTGPTVTDVGEELSDILIAGGGAGNSSGGKASTFAEWVLDPGDYLIRLTNIAGAAKILHLELDLYENV